MASTRRNQHEGFEQLFAAHDALVKAGQKSLTAAWKFGHVVRIMKEMGYSYLQQGLMLGYTNGGMVSVYARLAGKYETDAQLIRTAEAMGTYDVTRLAAESGSVVYHYEMHCTNCGGTEWKREKVGERAPAPVEVPVVAFSPN